jgi:2,7-dihydroxy-5-methyl-1-naphthoate 7-O-methyltransferase
LSWSRPDLSSLTDLQTPWCIRVAATLRIAEHMAAGTQDIGELAAAVRCDRRALHELLGYLVGQGVFCEPGPGQFGLNETARELLDPAVHIGLDLDGIGGRMAHAWGTLLTYVRTGTAGYQEAFGRPFWDDLDANPDVAASFDALIGPTGHGRPNVDFEVTGGWKAVKTVVDVGGGTGATLAEILLAHPHVRGILVDLPRTVARSAEIFRGAGVSDRVTVCGQSFFDPLPAGEDLYMLKNVLHDWPDTETGQILRRCAEAARPEGRVVAIGAAMPDGSPPTLDIVTVLTGGRANSLSEFQKIAAQNGLEVVAAQQRPPGLIVECVPV